MRTTECGFGGLSFFPALGLAIPPKRGNIPKAPVPIFRVRIVSIAIEKRKTDLVLFQGFLFDFLRDVGDISNKIRQGRVSDLHKHFLILFVVTNESPWGITLGLEGLGKRKLRMRRHNSPRISRMQGPETTSKNKGMSEGKEMRKGPAVRKWVRKR